MNKHNIFNTVLLALFSVAFALVSFIIRLNRNRTFFISQKIKLGTAIITLTSFLSSCSENSKTEHDTCYKVASPDTSIIIKDTSNNKTKGTIIKNQSFKKAKTTCLKDTVIHKNNIHEATCYMVVLPEDTL